MKTLSHLDKNTKHSSVFELCAFKNVKFTYYRDFCLTKCFET